jgi:uncharacterized protein (TIGR02265 family)
MAEPLSGKLVDGLFRRVLGPELSPALRAQLLAEGIDLAAPEVPSTYPRETWYRAVDLTAAALFPGEAGPEALRRLGRHVLEALRARGMLKRTWLVAGRLMGPRRALLQAASYSARGPVRLEVVELGHSRFEVWAEESRQPEFLAGLVEGACQLLGGRSPRVEVVGSRGDGVVLDASWR